MISIRWLIQKLIFFHFCSDKPGNHNFELLRKLVLPDGSVLRARLPGRPTRDCLFIDPARDGTRYHSFLFSYTINLHLSQCESCDS